MSNIWAAFSKVHPLHRPGALALSTSRRRTDAATSAPLPPPSLEHARKMLSGGALRVRPAQSFVQRVRYKRRRHTFPRQPSGDNLTPPTSTKGTKEGRSAANSVAALR